MAELTGQKATTLQSLGQPDEAETYYQEAIDLFEDAGAMANVAETSILLGRLQSWRFDLDGQNRTVRRALNDIGATNPHLEASLTALKAFQQGWEGDVQAAADSFDAVRSLHQALGVPAGVLMEQLQGRHFWQSMQFGRLVETYSLVTSACRTAGDWWGVSDAEFLGLSAEALAGRPADAAADLPSAIMRAETMGHYGALWVLKILVSMLSAARGELAQGGKETILRRPCLAREGNLQ